MASFDCWHFSCPCENNVCQKPCSTIRVIQRRVRMPMTLSSSRKASLAVSKVGDTFSGPSDRLVPSVNTLTGKVGVDKKHNSFARYLARKTGPVIRRDLQYSRGTIECGQNCCCPPCCEDSLPTGTTLDINNTGSIYTMSPVGKLCKNGTYRFDLDSQPTETEIGFSVGGGWPPGTQIINDGVTGWAAIIPLNCTKETSLFVYENVVAPNVSPLEIEIC